MTASQSHPAGSAHGRNGELAGDGFDPREIALSIRIERRLGTIVVTLSGTLGPLAATRLAATLRDLIDGQGNLAIDVRLAEVDRVDAPGVHVLSAAAADLERRGGRLSLCEARDGLLRALNIVGLAPVVDSPLVDEAGCGPAAGGHADLRGPWAPRPTT
jgi:anti-anti-sigma factor